mmetsp:Transcript_47548/g.142038  ORF Transcript_47548/g.142038 Transcript_47548/m.142038 type:complete len:216 (-) Transcript_47548:216-863(-)
MIASVKVCQPHLEWELACPRRTVRVAFSSSTPSRAHFVRLPSNGALKPGTSASSSLKTFLRLGGSGTPWGTLKLRPSACPGPWYGSWPMTTALTSSSGVRFRARKTSSFCGKTLWAARSAATKRAMSAKYGFANSSASACCQLSECSPASSSVTSLTCPAVAVAAAGSPWQTAWVTVLPARWAPLRRGSHAAVSPRRQRASWRPRHRRSNADRPW